MGNEQIIKEINREIDEQKLNKLKEQVKAYKLEQLELQEKYKAEKEKVEEKLRIIKLNLENLDRGNFEAIEERMKKSELAKATDTEKRIEKMIEIWREYHPYFQPIVWSKLYNQPPYSVVWWDTMIGGTYNVTTTSGEIKTFYF